MWESSLEVVLLRSSLPSSNVHMGEIPPSRPNSNAVGKVSQVIVLVATFIPLHAMAGISNHAPVAIR